MNDVVESYSFSNFQLQLSGFDTVNLESWEADHKVDVTVRIGKSGEAVSYAVKKFEREGKCSIEAGEELQKLLALAAPYGGDLIYLPPLPMVASFQPDGRPRLRYIAPQVKITDFKLSAKQGDDALVVPIGFKILQRPIIEMA